MLFDWCGPALRVANVSTTPQKQSDNDNSADTGKPEGGWVPGFSIAFAEEKLFYLNIEAQKNLYLNGLAGAGVR